MEPEKNLKHTITYASGGALLGESPLWDEREMCFNWVDIESSKFYTLWLNDDKLADSKCLEIPLSPLEAGQQPPRVTAMAPCEDGGFVCAFANEGFGSLKVVDDDEGNFSVETSLIAGVANPLLDTESELSGSGPHPPSERFNDGKCSPEGRFFAGCIDDRIDTGLDEKDFEVMKPFHGTMDGMNTMAPLLYKLAGFMPGEDKKIAVPDKAVGHMMCSNGPTWSLDGTKFYHACSYVGRIKSYDYDKVSGTMSNEKVLIEMTPEIGGAFDGATMDAQGYLWWAIYAGSKVIRIDPATGAVERMIDVPEMKSCTSVAFGGPDYRTLLVTSCSRHIKEADKKGRNGAVALIRFEDPEIRGVAPARWNGKA